MDAGVAAVLAALITAAGAVVAAMVMSRHKADGTGLKTSAGLPPLPPLEPYRSAGPSIAPGVSGVHDATLKFAGFWVRLLAGAIDVVLLFVLAAVVGWLRGLDAHFDVRRDWHLYAAVLYSPAVVLVFYHFFFPSMGSWQATPGKMMCGLRVIRVDGGWVTPLLALRRFLLYFVSALPAGLGFFMIGWDDQKRGLHDRICDTRVVYTPEGWRMWSRVLGG
jgi:uncharacterized RDD family membrane protein YckC